MVLKPLTRYSKVIEPPYALPALRSMSLQSCLALGDRPSSGGQIIQGTQLIQGVVHVQRQVDWKNVYMCISRMYHGWRENGRVVAM